MRILAYCDRRYRAATEKAVGRGATLLTSPPLDSRTLSPDMLEGYDLLYFDLHGTPGEGVWYGDGTVALLAEQLRVADLSGSVVFALNCYLADEDSPMLDALLAAGARLVIGGDGINWGGRRRLIGAGRLGLWFRRLMVRGLAPLHALAVAKVFLRWGVRNREAIKDTLAFRAYYRRQEDEIV